MSNKDLTTCFNGNKHILSTRTSLRLLRVPDDGQSLPETACLLSIALMPVFLLTSGAITELDMLDLT